MVVEPLQVGDDGVAVVVVQGDAQHGDDVGARIAVLLPAAQAHQELIFPSLIAVYIVQLGAPIGVLAGQDAGQLFPVVFAEGGFGLFPSRVVGQSFP